MKHKIVDKKYRFISAFDTETGAYVRTGVIDERCELPELFPPRRSK